MAKSKTKVLIVEDDPTLAEMYGTKFTAEGFDVLHAGDGVEGLEMAKTKKPDAILLDVMMPKMDGFATLKELKADKILKKIPVIMLTNLGQEEDVKKGKDLGAEDYFVKANQTPAEIVVKVKALLK
ncbi:TPA: response regulator [Candidatus Veblenbacteria bacterium]|nr:response regulator [Candidatus Veblenbacteria bacterium]